MATGRRVLVPLPLVAATALVVVALGAVVAWLATGGSATDRPEAGVPAGGATALVSPGGDFHTVREDGFSIGYPARWVRMSSNDPHVALVARSSRSAADVLLVRTFRIPAGADPTRRRERLALADQLLRGAKVDLLVRRPVTLAGTPGVYYLYTFRDHGRHAVHAHYVLFGHRRGYVLVMQAEPDTDFVELAPVFDRIARSFRASPVSRP